MSANPIHTKLRDLLWQATSCALEAMSEIERLEVLLDKSETENRELRIATSAYEATIDAEPAEQDPATFKHRFIEASIKSCAYKP